MVKWSGYRDEKKATAEKEERSQKYKIKVDWNLLCELLDWGKGELNLEIRSSYYNPRYYTVPFWIPCGYFSFPLSFAWENLILILAHVHFQTIKLN